MNTNKTNTELGTIFDYTENRFEDKKFFFVLTDANSTSSYLDKKNNKPVKVFPNSFSLQMEVQVYDRNFKDPKTGKVSPRKRVMRYVPGESIWKDEQIKDRERDSILPKEYIDFIEGRRLIEGTDTAFLEFMMNDDRNESKPGRDVTVNSVYRLVEVGAELKKEIEKEMRLNELRQWCYGAGDHKDNWDQVAAYARALNVSLNRDASEVRFRMVQMATHDPIKFLAGMNNQAVQRKHYVLTAIDMDILIKDDNMNSLIWRENNSLLMQAPMGMDPVDYFVDSTTTARGEEIFATLMSKLGKKEKKKKEPEFQTAANVGDKTLQSSGVTMAEAEALVKEAIACGVIKFYGKSTYAYAFEQADQRKFTGMKAVLAAVKQEPEFYAKVKAKMN